MPVERNDFAEFSDMTAANVAALKAMGLAMLQVANPMCPVAQKNGGNLRRSTVSMVDRANLCVDVGPAADYGGYVHDGTKKMKARPWLRQAYEGNRESIAALGKETYAREARR